MRRLAVWTSMPAEFLAIWPATLLLFIVSPLVAPGSISGSALLTVLAFASILAIGRIGGIPYLALTALVAVVLFELVCAKAASGRFIAIGTNGRAARAAGMRVARY
jgi:ribose/xylose/arabinose/galactoside ABC-type transport system permease subunit